MNLLIKLLLRHNSKHKADIITATVYSILGKVSAILAMILFLLLLDLIIQYTYSVHPNPHITSIELQIYTLGIIAGILSISDIFFNHMSRLKWCSLAKTLQHDLRIETYTHIQNLSLDFFDTTPSNVLTSLFDTDIKQLNPFLSSALNQVVQAITACILIIVIFFIINAKFACLTIVILALIALSIFYYQRAIKSHYLLKEKEELLFNQKICDNLSNIISIKSFVAEKFVTNALNKLSIRLLNIRNITNHNNIIGILLATCGFFALLVFSSTLTLNNNVSLYQYLILTFSTLQLFFIIINLNHVVDDYPSFIAACQKITQFLNTPVSIYNGNIDLDKKSAGAIIFDQVTFAYPKQNKNAINNLSFAITPHEKVAFVGNIGSGKSTIAKLLMHFYDVNHGTILVNYNNIKHLNLNSLRNNIGIVSQNTLLINGTIAENISYGSFNTTSDEIIHNAKLVGLDPFIRTLTHGYDTNLTECSEQLSIVQKQRIAIARAILKNPTILILDEVQFDIDNELFTQHRFEQIINSRSTIILSSNVKNLPLVDRIYVLHNGMIVEHGTHDQLVNTDGFYSDLFNHG